MRTDFHMHTTASDGYWSPADLRREVERRGLVHWAVTDHDTYAGYAAIADASGLIPGVEVTSWAESREVHIVLLGGNWQDESIRALLARVQSARRQRILDLIDLVAHRHRRSADELRAALPNADVLTRSHLAAALVQTGYCAGHHAAFTELIGDEHIVACGEPAYPEPAEVCAVAEAMGAASILAHPAIYQDIYLVERLMRLGIAGLETKHRGCKAPTSKLFRKLACTHHWLQSSGSDFHMPPCRIGDWHHDRATLRPLMERVGVW